MDVIDRVVGVFVRRSGAGERRWLFCRAIGVAGGVRGGDLGIGVNYPFLPDLSDWIGVWF